MVKRLPWSAGLLQEDYDVWPKRNQTPPYILSLYFHFCSFLEQWFGNPHTWGLESSEKFRVGQIVKVTRTQWYWERAKLTNKLASETNKMDERNPQKQLTGGNQGQLWERHTRRCIICNFRDKKYYILLEPIINHSFIHQAIQKSCMHEHTLVPCSDKQCWEEDWECW